MDKANKNDVLKTNSFKAEAAKIIGFLDSKINEIEGPFQESLDKYFYKEGIPEIIIHGVEIPVVNEETNEESTYLKQKADFDVFSALHIFDLAGIKYKEGSKTTWIHPSEKLQYNKNEKPYFMIDGIPKYLKKGTVVIDVAGTYGAKIAKGDILQFDHHGDDSKGQDTTSATNEIYESLKDNENFQKNIKENTNTEDLKWLENYVNFVTKVDNLDYDVNPENWENYHNTLYAVQKYFNSSNQGVILDLYRNYGDVSLEGFSADEMDYIIATGDITYRYNDKKKEKPIFKNIKPLVYDGKNQDVDDLESDLFYKERLIRLKDVAQLQKISVLNTNEAIDESRIEMFLNNFNENSPVLGKTLIEEVDRQDKTKKVNKFTAVGAYGNGYDSYIILNTGGDQKNEVFVSSKKDTNLFVENIKEEFKKELGNKYSEKLVQPVRDSMVVMRDPALKKLETDKIREIIAKALKIDGYDIKSKEKDTKDKILESSRRTQELLNRINN